MRWMDLNKLKIKAHTTSRIQLLADIGFSQIIVRHQKKVVLKKKRLGQAFNAKGIAILAGFLTRLISHLKLSGA
jgi:hypothetical protein